MTDENSSPTAELELRVIAAREAVVAAVRAAAIGVQRPVERHALHGVQRRPAGHFLIAGAVGSVRGIRQAVDRAVLLHLIGDVPRRGLLRREIKEEGIDFHGESFVLSSPILPPFSSSQAGPTRVWSRGIAGFQPSSRSMRLRSPNKHRVVAGAVARRDRRVTVTGTRLIATSRSSTSRILNAWPEQTL